MIVAGLTGSVGMGKSTVLSMFADLGAAVWSADDAVGRLYAKGGAGVGPVAAEFPEAEANGAIDRARLSALVIGRPARLARLEAIVHPLVLADRAAFLARADRDRARLAVVDIPLLFETGAEKDLDAVIVVSAPEAAQRARVLARPGMTEEKLAAIIARQTPDAEKRARADHVIDTGSDLSQTRREVAEIAEKLLKRSK